MPTANPMLTPAALDEPLAGESPVKDPAPAAAARLARLIDKDPGGWWVSLGGRARLLPVDAAVDPALLADAHRQQARVLVEDGPRPTIVGVVMTARPVTIDRQGAVDIDVERFSVTARREAILKSASAFLRLSATEAEVYGVRLVMRARETARFLARMLSLN